MYIRRACLQAIGDFDEAHFGKGYGEENDFCIRAQKAGWVNLHALDTFVRHVGGISFGDTKSERELNAMRTLAQLHPRYDSEVHQFIGRDPAQWARRVVDLARITCSDKPVILNVTHNREGGTLRHLQEMGQHLATHATFLRLSPAPGGVALRLEGACDDLLLHFNLPQDQARLVRSLQDLQVSAHFFIRRQGQLWQLVSCDDRAWHAGVSSFNGQDQCNDFSIGIELEGLDGHTFEASQYETLSTLCAALRDAYPIEHIAGHEHIAVGRKQDPGPGFDWARLQRDLGWHASHFPST